MDGLPSFFYINKQEYQILNKRSFKFGEKQYQVRRGTVPSSGRNSTKFGEEQYRVLGHKVQSSDNIYINIK